MSASGFVTESTARASLRDKTSSRRRPNRFPLAPATAADHVAVSQFLGSIFQDPMGDQFSASVASPGYRPRDRLLIKHQRRIVGHVLGKQRTMGFGSAQLPAVVLEGLSVLPEHRGQGLGYRLLEAAEKRAMESGAVIGFLSTNVPEAFREKGWVSCGRPCRSQAGIHDLLAELSERGFHHRMQTRFNIRPCRRMELGALARIYRENTAGLFGPPARDEKDWLWLAGSRGYDEILVALDGPDPAPPEDYAARVLGYAITYRDQIVEFFCSSKCPKADVYLLARACRDAIDRNHHAISFDGPAGNRLHKLFRSVNGRRTHGDGACPNGQGQVRMAKVLNPMKLLRTSAGVLRRRLQATDFPLPLDLGLAIENRKYRLEITPRECQVVARSIGRSYLAMNASDFTRLMLGRLDWRRADHRRCVEPSTQIALQARRVLFPRLSLWWSSLEDLPARE